MTDKNTVQSQQAIPETPWRIQTQSTAIIAVILIVGIIIGALYLAQATTTATTGSQLLEFERTRQYLERANEDIQAQIAYLRDYSKLLGRSHALGFHAAEPTEVEYLVVPGYVPDRATPTPQITPTATFVYDETFNGWVQQQWNRLVGQFEAWAGRDRAGLSNLPDNPTGNPNNAIIATPHS